MFELVIGWTFRIKSLFIYIFDRNFLSKLTYIRPGFVLTFRLEPVNRKELSKAVLDLNDVSYFLFTFILKQKF